MVSIEYLATSSLTPHPENPRLIKDKNFKNLCQSLKENPDYFETRPILVNKDMVIFAGNMRWRAAKEIGMEKVPVAVMDISEERQKELMLRDNRSAGEFDFDKLFNFPEDLLEKVGFDEDEINRILGGGPDAETSEDEFDVDGALQEEPRVKQGEIWALGRHKLSCTDATSHEAVKALWGEDKATMMFTDPPYGVKYVGKTKDALTIENDAMDEEGTEELWTKAYAEAREILVDGGLVYATVPAGPLHLLFARVMKDWGDLRQIMVWVKDRFVLGRSDYHYRHEPILYGWKSTGSHHFNGGRDKDTVWEVPRPSASKEHPTMKPLALVAKALNDGSREDGLVYDPFGGSGSTLIACEQTGRTCYTSEIDPKYATVILNRWEKLTGDKGVKIA